MKRKIKIAIAVAIIIAAGVVAARWFLNEEQRLVDYPINLYGNVDIRTADLGFNEQERVTRICVEEGQRVEAGQPLANQDTRQGRLAAARFPYQT